MSGVAPCAPEGVTGTLVTTAALCNALDEARKVDLLGPSVTPPTPVTDEMMPDALKKAMTDCTGTSSCKFIGYDFDSDVATKASASRYVVDTYSTTAENSGVLVLKGKKTTGTVSGVTPDATTGGSTGTVTYTADNGQSYTFQGKWRSVQTSGASVDVYFDPANMSKGALRPEDLGFAPPMLVQPPGYELPDFQSTVVTTANSLGTPAVASVEECAEKCDLTTGCTGFNFGGLDTSTICELVKDTTTREYADNKSGFRKETISSTQTGDGTNPSGTDFTNEGAYCRDAPACNTDIARIITDNAGSTNQIATLSTSDIESCAYCPIRTYAAAGNVTTNEIGVSKSNPTPAAAITELQYSSDGTFAEHLTFEHGGLYNVKFYVARHNNPYDPNSTADPWDDISVVASSNGSGGWKFAGCTNNGNVGSGMWYENIYDPWIGTSDYFFNMTPAEYVTNGFILISNNGETFRGYSTATSPRLNAWVTNPYSKYSIDYNKTILVFKPISFKEFMQSLKMQSGTTPKDTNPFIYKKRRDITITGQQQTFPFYKIDIDTKQAHLFSDTLLLQWYSEFNPSAAPWINTVQVITSDGFWDKQITMSTDMPDPYAALGQFRTLDVAPPSTAQSWAYNNNHPGCDKNCGNITNGYAIYHCTASGGGNCDPGKGASVSGQVCDGTYISCRPTDDSADLKAQFSFKFRGLLPASTKVTTGGSNSDHNTDALRVRTIYTLDSSFSVTTTPNESIQKIYSIFPQFVIDRILRTPNLASLVPAAMCPPGTYVRDYGFGLKACDACPGSPTLASNQVFQPDTVNPGNFMCTIATCPDGQFRDLMTNRCRTPCQPGQFIAADGTCGTCPDQTLAGNQYWTPDITNVGSYTCVKNQCTGNQYVNAKKSGCRDKCFPGYGPDPANPGQCIKCTVTPTRLQKWVSETLGSVGGEVTSYTCELTTCPDGQSPPSTNDVCNPCDQLTGFPTGVTTTFGQGCQVKACLVDSSSVAVASATVVAPTVTPPANCGIGGCTPVGSCSLVCKPGFTGPTCSPCPQPPGIKATYSTACIATSCSVDTSSPDASKVTGATLTNGNCIASCAPGFWKYLEYGCYACGARTGDDPLTTRTYTTNSCDPASCAVDASLVGKATTAPATVPGTTASVCMLTPAPGYEGIWSTSVTGDYMWIAGPFDFKTVPFTRTATTIFQCPVGDSGTTYTYSSRCAMSTCTYTNPNDANETAAQMIGSTGYNKCTKVCKTGYKRDASGKCTVACSQPSDLGLTATFGPYGCKISACTSSSGFPTTYGPAPGATYGTDAFMYGDVCSIICPSGARQYTNTNASPNRQDCAKCSTDLSLQPWIYDTTCKLITNYCSTYGPIFTRSVWIPGGSVVPTATAIESGGVCRTTCTAGYVKDSYGLCRKCPNETPSSISTVVNGVCVTTCKANHTRDVAYDGKEFNYLTEQRFDTIFGVNGRTITAGQLDQSEIVCPQCTNGTYWDYKASKCISCSTASTTSTKITALSGGGCTMSCNAGYVYNRATGVCDTCPAGSYCLGGSGYEATNVVCSAGTYCPAGSTTTTACSAGYSCPTGSGSATACTLTPVTGYIWANPAVDCTTKKCPAGSYCPNATTQTVCASGKYCPEGSSAESACPTGSYCSTPATSATCSTTACASGTWKSADCSSTSDRVCSNCRLPCVYAGGEYEASPCTATADRTCGSCSTTPCASGTYQSAACSTTANRVCTTCTTCSTGQYQTAACTATSNRTCATCSTCPAGQYQTAACTATADTGCTSCAACGANSTRTGCGGTSPGSCVCNAGSEQYGTACYIKATSYYTCPAGYSMLSDGSCKSKGTQGGCASKNGKTGACAMYNYNCPIVGNIANNCTASNYTTYCCTGGRILAWSCPSGGTATAVPSGSVLCI